MARLHNCHNFIVTLIVLLTPISHQFGFGGSSGPLYTSKDRGITLLDVNNFSQIVHNSSTAWMVEFYSSWCGHCIRFAPIFKELGQNVENWNSIIRLGAIDCAQDENVATCRNYEIMGYPSLKFFPPLAKQNDLGEMRESMSKDISLMMADMSKYVMKLSLNSTYNAFWKKRSWPDFTPMDQPIDIVWSASPGATNAILIAEPQSSALGQFAILELQTLAKDKVVFRRGLNSEGPLADLASLSSKMPFVVILVNKSSQEKKVIFQTADVSSEQSWQDLRKALNDFVAEDLQRGPTGHPEKSDEVNVNGDETRITKEEDIKRRRYTVFMSDLENAVLYSLTHEVGSRSSIVGPALVSLQNYLDVLVNNFPGRHDTMVFLRKLRDWVASHDDAIRGEDLIAEANDIRASFGSFTDTPNGVWIGCKGSKPFYGGYPCSLWTLWHTLTVNQKVEEHPPHKVLDAMVGYVKHFFGCEDCVRHFLQAAEDGEALPREVGNKSASILWLWKAHNKANLRLSGDITDDKAFPKEVFPNRQHCSDCYNSRLGGDLWSEFDRKKVVEFLTDLYQEENLNYQGLRFKSSSKDNNNDHALAAYKKDSIDEFHNNYDRAANASPFWGPVDLSLCFSVYLLSAIILILAYFKFVAKRKCPCFMTGLFASTRRPGGLYNVV